MTIVVIAHVGPVVGHVEVHTVVAPGTAFGKFMIFHDDGHRCTHTACERLAGNLAVEWRLLAPGGGVESDGAADGIAAHHVAARGAGHRLLHIRRGLDLTLEAFHQPLHGMSFRESRPAREQHSHRPT